MKTRVSIVKCRTYAPEEVQASVTEAFELLGGLSSFIKEGEKVLVKPNILSARPPEHGVNTHLEVIRTCVRLVKKEGAVPMIGDNPGGSVAPRQAYEGSGLLNMAEEEGVECLEVRDVRMVRGLPIASYFFECDKIVSLPKMKTHSLMGLTGAIKNMYGAIAGLNKSHCHKKYPRPGGFANVLVDVFEVVRPHLILMDAVVAMDEGGPAAGRLRDVGLLLAGGDSVAIDSVFSRLIGIDPMDIITTKEAKRRGLGESAMEDIEILGESIEDSFIDDFRLPGSKLLLGLPDPIAKFLADFINFGPYIQERLCMKCNICTETCPVTAIRIDDKISKIDYNKCIKCMCCHEVCPYKAIELKRNILAKLFGL